jgi:hypothetical protein
MVYRCNVQRLSMQLCCRNICVCWWRRVQVLGRLVGFNAGVAMLVQKGCSGARRIRKSNLVTQHTTPTVLCPAAFNPAGARCSATGNRGCAVITPSAATSCCCCCCWWRQVQEIGQELGRLSGESLSFLKASWQKTVAAASQQQQQISERLRQQREQQQQGAAGSPNAPAAVAASQSTPQLHAAAGYEAEGWDDQQHTQQQHRSASEACIAGANSSRGAPAWLPAGGGGSAGIAAGAASAGQNLLAGFQQGGRQLKALTSRLGSRLLQQQQQYNAAADASLQDAAAGAGQRQAGPDWQAAQQQPLGYAGKPWSPACTALVTVVM